MILTTYFANVRNLPGNVIPISICAKPPAAWSGFQYKKLAPRYADLQEYKKSGDEERFAESYISNVLFETTPANVMHEIYDMIGCSGDIALVCYEKSSDFCHRHLVAYWLRDHGYVVKEFQKGMM